MIAFSSGAVLAYSPLSGGYAGAKATVKYIAGYAADEPSGRPGLRFCAVLPQLTPATGLGARRAAYAERSGLSVDEFLARRGPLLTPSRWPGRRPAAGRDEGAGAYLLSAAGLRR